MKKISLIGCMLLITSTAPSFSAKQVIVGPEDTVYGIAYNEGVLTRSIISANNLTPPYALTPGQILIIPSSNEHIAARGETLKTIAEIYSVNVDVLAQENGLLPSYTVKRGDTFVIPPRDTQSMTEVLMAPAPEIVSTSLEPLPLVKSIPTSSPSKASTLLPTDIADELAREHKVPGASLMGNLADKNKGAPLGDEALPKDKSPAKKDKKTEKEEKAIEKEEEKEILIKKESLQEKPAAPPAEITFSWPVEGTVIKEFAAGTNDGISIRIEEGTPVKAAAGGEIIYVGDEIKNLGNLILIKHDQGYVTAYAYLDDILVKKGGKVKKGETIAHSGTSGEAKNPALYFEIRKGKKPINPTSKLQSSK